MEEARAGGGASQGLPPLPRAFTAKALNVMDSSPQSASLGSLAWQTVPAAEKGADDEPKADDAAAPEQVSCVSSEAYYGNLDKVDRADDTAATSTHPSVAGQGTTGAHMARRMSESIDHISIDQEVYAQPAPSGVGGAAPSAAAQVAPHTPAPAPPVGTNSLARPIPPGRKIHWNEIGEGGFSDMKFLGCGEFCSVFSTTIDGGMDVAIKMLRPAKLSSPSAIRDLEFEMHLMSRIRHKHVLGCIGTSIPGVFPDRMFIMLRMLRSTLAAALPPPPLPDGTSTFQRMAALKNWPLRRSLQHTLELAIAMCYLHDKCFAGYWLLHRDLKPKNLGLMSDGRLVVFDFGVSKLIRRNPAAQPPDEIDPKLPMTGMVGSLRYMAPEVAEMKPYNHKSEVYSFAIVAWEMIALKRPYDTITPETFTKRVAVSQERPKLDEKKIPPNVCALLERCWAADSDTRPEFSEVVQIMMTAVAEQSVRKKR